MYTYGFRLLDFTPNAVTCMSVFAHMCENFVGVVPNVSLFRHFFIPRIEGDALSGSITWIPRGSAKEAYLMGQLHLKWEEWRAEWCWIQEKDFPEFCVPRKEKVVRGKDWSDYGKCDDKLTPALNRIIRLKAAGLTIEMVGADFLWRRIAPLQKRKRYTWEYQNAADIMRLHTGLDSNLTVLEHISLCHQLFRASGKFHLPKSVVPLCINSAKDSILAMMPECNAQGVEALWQKPYVESEMAWLANLTERPTREEKDLIRNTTDEELAYMASRAEELKRPADASSSQSVAVENEEERADEDPAEEHQEEPAGERGEAAGEPEEEEEPPVVPVPKRRRRVLKKADSQEPVHPSLLEDEPTDKEVATRVTRQQGARRQTSQAQATRRNPSRRRTASSADEAEASHAAATASPAIKRPRASPPPVTWDLSILSDPEDEE